MSTLMNSTIELALDSPFSLSILALLYTARISVAEGNYPHVRVTLLVSYAHFKDSQMKYSSAFFPFWMQVLMFSFSHSMA